MAREYFYVYAGGEGKGDGWYVYICRRFVVWDACAMVLVFVVDLGVGRIFYETGRRVEGRAVRWW